MVKKNIFLKFYYLYVIRKKINDCIANIDSAFFVLKKEGIITKHESKDVTITAYPLLKSWNEGSLEPIDSITIYDDYTNIENTADIDGQLDVAVQAALDAPFPDASELRKDIFEEEIAA